MMQDELILVFQDAYFDTQLNRHTCFTFANPFDAGFKNGEYFLFVRNDFAFNDAMFDLVDLAFGVLQG